MRLRTPSRPTIFASSITPEQSTAAQSSSDWLQRRTAVAIEMRRRKIAHLAAGGTTDLAPAPLHMDAGVYTDPLRFAAEKREVFNRLPLVVGLSGDLPEPGDVLTFDLAGPPILITRGRDRQVHAFLNICSHRGMRLVNEGGKRSRISCPFHAWTFDLTGSLIGVPGREGFDGISLAARGLTRLPVAEWNGLIFVRATPGSEPIDVESFLGSFAPELAQLELGSAKPVKSGILDAKANWKYVLDTYGESYHFARLHEKTLAPVYFSNVAVYEDFARHYRISFPSKDMQQLVDQPEAQWPPADFGAVHLLFPNTVIFIGSVVPGKTYIQVFNIFPGETVGDTRVSFAVYGACGQNSESYLKDVAQAYDATAQVVLTEDFAAAAAGWNSLARSPGFRIVLGRNEIALQSFQRNIAAAIDMALPCPT